MNHDFLKTNDFEFYNQLKQFSNKIGDYQVTLGLLPVDVTDAAVISAYFKFVLDMQIAHVERAKSWTTYKELFRKPGSGLPAVSIAPVTFVVPVAPTAPAMGIETWLRQIVKRIKGSKNYTEGIGQDLGILAFSTDITTADMKPILKIQLVGGQPLIIWKKDQMDGIEIYKDSGDGQWHLLKYDLRPNHLDTSVLPKPGDSATWKYKAIYMYHDERVGSWSDEALVAVSGTI